MGGIGDRLASPPPAPALLDDLPTALARSEERAQGRRRRSGGEGTGGTPAVCPALARRDLDEPPTLQVRGSGRAG
ncbi:hypothetical protein [Streptomyces sp. NBC_00557]|uniref:hypothetical protein n=1 Tax=Streptomyces sp. NBC_00557 TaxID=2975776 RepID=UPI002E805343|nr:hypothetical protein [Streptomyces sp. NBC_00557]WUC39138.1 hypothetical protein OG956_35385 [Streptomyces sp. NBC_00557]